MKIQGNLIIFSTNNEERKDVRRLKEKKLQVLLDENNNLPIFEVSKNEYIRRTAERKIEEIFKTKKFYIEQLYTWGNPEFYTEENEILVTYLVIVNKKNINDLPENLNFYDISIKNKENTTTQHVELSNEKKNIQYEIATILKRNRESVEYLNRLVKKSNISELTTIIIHTGIKRLRNRIENTNIAFSFLDKEFAVSELQQVYEIILDKKLISANFRKKIEPMIKRTDKVIKESAYRPSVQYTFNEDYIKKSVL